MKHIIVLVVFISISLYLSFERFKENKEFEFLYAQGKNELLEEYIRERSDPKRVKNLILKAHSYTSEFKKELDIVESIDLKVDFYPQSPFGKWWPIFNDTCEEASLLLALNYIRNKSMSREAFRDELLDIVSWQKNRFWYFENTTVKETSIILKEYYDFSDFLIIDNPSIDDIKMHINNNSIVIAPLYGKYLNPHFVSWGPTYHFVVIKWYTPNSFITHDVWTKYWADYSYDIEELYSRIHDYNSWDIKNWDKKIIVLKR